jgi:hypothetical protein
VISIALASAGKNSAPSELANENTAPSDAESFDAANPISEATALAIGDLAAGEWHAFCVRRAVPAKTTQAVTNDDWRLGMSAYI